MDLSRAGVKRISIAYNPRRAGGDKTSHPQIVARVCRRGLAATVRSSDGESESGGHLPRTTTSRGS
jgi:hypothetical protein